MFNKNPYARIADMTYSEDLGTLHEEINPVYGNIIANVQKLETYFGTYFMRELQSGVSSKTLGYVVQLPTSHSAYLFFTDEGRIVTFTYTPEAKKDPKKFHPDFVPLPIKGIVHPYQLGKKTFEDLLDAKIEFDNGDTTGSQPPDGYFDEKFKAAFEHIALSVQPFRLRREGTVEALKTYQAVDAKMKKLLIDSNLQ